MSDKNLQEFGNSFKKQVTKRKRRDLVNNNAIGVGDGFFVDKSKKRLSGLTGTFVVNPASGYNYPDVINSDKGE